MKNLIIIGAGGMGRSICDRVKDYIGYKTEFEIKGFLDNDIDVLNNFDGYPSIIGSIDSYNIEKDDVFISSMGGVQNKKKCIEKILSKGGEFISLIHKTAHIGNGVVCGKGCIIDHLAVVDVEAIIGDFVLIQIGSVVGHDAEVGNYSRIDCHSTLVGGVKIGNEVCIHTGSVISHNVVIEDKACVGACSFVIRKVKSGKTVFGSPAKEIL